MKKVIIFSFFFSLAVYQSANAISWEKVEIDRIIDGRYYKLIDERIITPIGIDIPTFYDERKDYQCQARKVTRSLDELFKNNTILIAQDIDNRNSQGVYPRHIKVEKINISEFLLKNGLASLNQQGENAKHFASIYKKAEQIAKDQQIGIWSQCGKKHEKNPYEMTNLWGTAFRKDYGQYLAPISVGKVIAVPTGDTIILENGLKIRLLGIQSPTPDDTRKHFQCFGQYSQKYLEHLILGKKIFLEEDTQDLSSQKELLRYIKLPLQNKSQDELFINEIMITQGFARSFWPDEMDNEHRERFKSIQQEVYKNPKGAWKYCLQELINPIINPPESLQKVLEYDPDCPIKGNISGTKSKPKKTYHTPESGWYKRIEYETCFKNEEAAQKEGFTKVR